MANPRLTSALVEANDLICASAGANITEREGVAILNVRGAGEIAKAVKSVLGVELPATPNTFNDSGDWVALWLGPDEWLLVSRDSMDATQCITALEAKAGKAHFALTNQSSGSVVLSLEGSKVREILRRGTPLDVDPSVFAAGQCAQTRLEKMAVVLVAHDNQPEVAAIDLIVRRSFADYMARWLHDAMTVYRDAG